MRTLEHADTVSTKVSGEKSKDLKNRLSELASRIRTAKPDKADLAEFKALLPHVDLAFADLARNNEQNLASLVTPKNDHALALTIRQACEDMRQSLGHADASAIERLIIDQIVLSWLRLQVAECKQTGHTEKRMIEFWEKRTNAAQMRFLRACESLTRMRKMMAKTPALQINIANQQVNQINS